MKLLNLGVLAHVDAGKTTLTERLLFEAGVIRKIGSVDRGTTQTDTLELERRRGITIRTAVASFSIGDVGVNLIDTPGHPDFIAEVERALRVLDGAILVVSAVEGVQAQTRVLMRALQRLAVPTALFVNKVDRVGADPRRVTREIAARLTPSIVPITEARDPGTRAASVVVRAASEGRHDELTRLLAEHSDAILGPYADDVPLSDDHLHDELLRQVAAVDVHPLFVGSALTGAGCALLTEGVTRLLPPAPQDREAAPLGRVFKVEPAAEGGKLAYLRMHVGTLHVRDRVALGSTSRPITSIDVFAGSGPWRAASVAAGEIGRVAGLAEVRVGDLVGSGASELEPEVFPPPAMEAVVDPVVPSDGPALRRALGQLAEQDPLINVRLDERGALAVSLYGEVQKEVLAATLELDFGLRTTFRETTQVYVERPAAVGAAVELLQERRHPISATVGLRVAPIEPGAGVRFQLGIESREAPIYIYKTHEGFESAIAGHVATGLESGLYGWRVTDCVVTLTDCDYYVGDGRVPPGTTRTSAADFKALVPIVFRSALEHAGTVVCEPVMQADLELPTPVLRAVTTLLLRLGARVESQLVQGSSVSLTARLSAAKGQVLQRSLHAASGGEGVCELHLVGYEAMHPPFPTR